MLIERYKGIAAYLSGKTGLSISENAARKWACRRIDPLPVQRMLGRVVAHRDELDAWLDRSTTAQGSARRR